MRPTSHLNTTALRTDLLQQSFTLNTQWCVVTGAPCSGKTTVLKELEQQGFNWNPEVARVYIEEQQALGHTLEKIRSDEALFQRGLIDTKLRVEADTPASEISFFDRAMPDSITYYRVGGLDPNQVLPDCFHFRYSAVFIFDPLPFVQDHARIENKQTAQFLDQWLERDYRALGYQVIRVPVMPINSRVEFILDKLQSQGIL